MSHFIFLGRMVGLVLFSFNFLADLPRQEHILVMQKYEMLDRKFKKEFQLIEAMARGTYLEGEKGLFIFAALGACKEGYIQLTLRGKTFSSGANLTRVHRVPGS